MFMYRSPQKNDSLKIKINMYLIDSYYVGYDLDNYFTNKEQIIMFERLLKCEPIFKQQWKRGFYVIPEVETETMYLSPYIKKQSTFKKTSRKMFKYTYFGKLTKGSQNLLKGYMIESSQTQIKTIDEKMNEIFCGIFYNISKRNQEDTNTTIIKAILTLHEPGIEYIIRSYLPA